MTLGIAVAEAEPEFEAPGVETVAAELWAVVSMDALLVGAELPELGVWLLAAKLAAPVAAALELGVLVAALAETEVLIAGSLLLCSPPQATTSKPRHSRLSRRN